MIATGLRQTVQIGPYDSPWYPMVRWQELGVLWPVGAGGLLGYQLAAFRSLRWPRRAPGAAVKGRAMVIAMIVAFIVAAALVAFTSCSRVAVPGRKHRAWRPPLRLGLIASPAFVAWLAVLTVMTTASCLSCYRRLEIEA